MCLDQFLCVKRSLKLVVILDRAALCVYGSNIILSNLGKESAICWFAL